ncbi:hypothetical protein VDG44_04440 [Xanthomonas campestris pv. raphani]|uniref:hypothetical protein n=1 Tax=Xanthomonas campestris TaxID=339 RepID=UPI002B23B7A3|nr:hypothetical protein [Xanthomonas campestris]MEA9903829.1 hypothetical protein [Xanthomonas campestris pv. raphani]
MASQQKARIAAGFLLGAWYLPEVQCINRQQPSTINHQPSTIGHWPSTTTNVPTYQLSRA